VCKATASHTSLKLGVSRKGLMMSIDIKWSLPIGGRDITMNLTEAVQAAIMIKPNDTILKKAKDLKHV